MLACICGATKIYALLLQALHHKYVLTLSWGGAIAIHVIHKERFRVTACGSVLIAIHIPEGIACILRECANSGNMV